VDNFCNIDFECIGNTGEVKHLINKRIGETPVPSQLNFELNLRHYRSEIGFKPD
jgi:hypothetical protein